MEGGGSERNDRRCSVSGMIERIEREAGVPGLAVILAERLVISGIGSERVCAAF